MTIFNNPTSRHLKKVDHTESLQDLYEKAATGDISAEEILFGILTERFVRILGHKLRGSRYGDRREFLDDLHDVAQEAVMIVYRKYREERIDSFAAWTQRILDLVFRKWLSKDLRRKERFLRNKLHNDIVTGNSASVEPAEIDYIPPWRRKEIVSEVSEALGKMNSEYSGVLVLLMKEKSVNEIMEEYPGDSHGAVYTRISRARKKLREMLGEKKYLFDRIILSDHEIIDDILASISMKTNRRSNGNEQQVH